MYNLTTLVLTASLAITATFASAGVTTPLTRSNVPAVTAEGRYISAPGFYLVGEGYFIGQASINAGVVPSVSNVTVVPLGVTVQDLGEVEAWLASVGLSGDAQLRENITCRTATPDPDGNANRCHVDDLIVGSVTGQRAWADVQRSSNDNW